MTFITTKESAELIKINWKIQAIIRKYGIKKIVFEPNGEYNVVLYRSKKDLKNERS